MSRMQTLLLLAGVTLVLCVASSVVFAQVDWLGQCWDGTQMSNRTEQPQQRCGNLVNCNTGPFFECEELTDKCFGTNTPTKGRDRRTTQVGDCVSADYDEKCYYCDGTRLICNVIYHYEDRKNGDCVDRCNKPQLFWMNGDDKCKP